MTQFIEMTVIEYFKLSTGEIAFVGNVVPSNSIIMPKSKAEIFVNGKKVKTISIIGEDRFIGIDDSIKKNKRSIRVRDEIGYIDENSTIKLRIYTE